MSSQNNRIIMWVLLATIGLSGSAVAGTINDSGEMYLWDPPEMRRDMKDMPGDRRCEYRGRIGTVVTENEESPLFMTQIVRRTAKVFQRNPATGKEELIYQWIVVEATNIEGDQLFFLGEHSPPEPRQMRILEGTGKFAGMRGSGDLGWDPSQVWPDGPDGAIRLDYSFQFTEPAGAVEPEPVYGDKAAPSTDLPKLHWTMRTRPELGADYLMPDGRRFLHNFQEGFLSVPEDHDHPMHGILGNSTNSRVFEPGGDFGGDLIYQWSIFEGTDSEGDQFFVLVENQPGVPQNWEILKGTGKFANAIFYGYRMDGDAPWPAGWPNSWKWPDGTSAMYYEFVLQLEGEE